MEGGLLPDQVLENTISWRDFIAYYYWNPMWRAVQLAYIQ